MNYKKFYLDTQKSLVDSLVSLWMPGQGKEQRYIKSLLEEEEPLLSEPVFQSIFPWEQSGETLQQHATEMKILDQRLVDAISSPKVEPELAFPKERHPYKHQTECWRGMLGPEGKTMVVTSGTGSGKTECFMIPVLQDIMERNEKDCVQAIFLYPLNALMMSQQRRMDAWCRAIPGQVTYAIYNGDTVKQERRQAFTDEYYPQLVTRPQIRRNPPQILFTNPTMLNYMLVRKEDQPILEKSRGKLRWILLDEAHTYMGSSAAELALQIRRVLNAFGVTADQVRFAITSATIGDKDKSSSLTKLKLFVSQITGKPIDKIKIVGGKRAIPALDTVKAADRIREINDTFGLDIRLENVLNLRKKLNESPVLSLGQIVKELGCAKLGRETALAIVDMLGDKCVGMNTDGKDAALLPTRAHFFIRAINGLYACVNDSCSRHRKYRPDFGSLTSFQNTMCPSCKSSLLEVASCPSCGKILITGEDSIRDGYQQRQKLESLDDTLFIENADTADDDSDDENVEIDGIDAVYTPFFLGKTESECQRTGAISENVYFDTESTPHRIRLADGRVPSRMAFKKVSKDGKSLCPHCGNEIKRNDLIYYRASANFLGRVIAPILLENAQPMPEDKITVDTVYEGRKFISFMDSRQGTARSASGLNQAVERNWIRSAIYHKLADDRLEGFNPATTLTEEEEAYFKMYSDMAVVPPVLQQHFDDLKRKREGSVCEPEPLATEWRNIRVNLENDCDFNKLFRHLGDTIHAADKDAYLESMFVDQFGRIPKRANSLETMGLVRLVYPDIINAGCPDGLTAYGITDSDWRDFLKICVDYVIRDGRHYMVSSSYSNYLTQSKKSSAIYPPDSTLRRGDDSGVDKWPCLKESKKNHLLERQGRIVLLLCAGMGITDVESITEDKKNLINASLKAAWDFIKDNVLSCTDNDHGGYKLNLTSTKVNLQIISDAWVCPVDSVVVDTVFKGYSPRIRGYVSAQNFARFKVGDKIHYPYFPFKSDKMGRSDVDGWINEKMGVQADKGLLPDLTKGIYEKSPIYIAAEHSAQQDRIVLDRYEKDFEKGGLNILSCSTTMEMGVDIGGFSEVMMNGVPPKSANYQQRAGRAGRRGESKTLAVTFCAANPVGANIWAHPDWPITHVTEMPLVNMKSVQVVRRHVNAYLFSQFVNQNDGMDINDRVVSFFGPEIGKGYNGFLGMLDGIFDRGADDVLVTGYKKIVKDTAFHATDISDAAHMAKQDISLVYDIYKKRQESLQKVIEDAEGLSEKSRAAKSARCQKENFEETNLLSFLAENGFLPSAGIPTGLVECDLSGKNNEGGRDKSPSMHLSQAISCYAPGTQVVKNEWSYKPAGIVMKTRYDDATARYLLQRCSNCGYATISYGTGVGLCPKCGERDTMCGVDFNNPFIRNIHFTEVVEPAGFAIDYNQTASRCIRDKASLNYIQPVLLEMEDWREHKSSAKMEIRTSTPKSQILFYNRGTSGNGFAFCPYCGRMEPENADVRRLPLVGHKHLRTSLQCEGGLDNGSRIRRNVLLVGRYQTDFVEIRFYGSEDNLVTEKSTLCSLGVIISRSLTDLLGIDDGEVDFGYNSAHHSIFIYDTALGGAGYSLLLRNYRDKVLEKARKSLSSCNCERACTHCLIDRKSQWFINDLDRKKALEWLETESKAKIVSESIKTIFPDAVKLTSDIVTEIYAATRDRSLQSINVFLSGDPKTWNPDQFGFGRTFSELELNGVSIIYILDRIPDITCLDAGSLSSVLPALMKFSFRIASNQNPQARPLAIITYASGIRKMFFGSDLTRSYDSDWGNGTLYVTENPPEIRSETYDAVRAVARLRSGASVFRIYCDSSTSDLLSTLESFEKEKWSAIFEKLSGRSVEVNYTDRYLVSPIGCYMVAHLLKSISDKHNIKFSGITFSLLKPNSHYSNNNGILLTDDFCDEKSRNDFLTDCIESLLQITPTFIEGYRGYVQHDRCLTITDKKVQLAIRPDAGIAYGWDVKRPCGVKYEDLQQDKNINIPLFNKAARQGILYTIVYNECGE